MIAKKRKTTIFPRMQNCLCKRIYFVSVGAISYVLKRFFACLSNQIPFLFRTINLRYSPMRRKKGLLGQRFFIDVFLFFRHNKEFRYLIGTQNLFFHRKDKSNKNFKSYLKKYQKFVKFAVSHRRQVTQK